MKVLERQYAGVRPFDEKVQKECVDKLTRQLKERENQKIIEACGGKALFRCLKHRRGQERTEDRGQRTEDRGQRTVYTWFCSGCLLSSVFCPFVLCPSVFCLLSSVLCLSVLSVLCPLSSVFYLSSVSSLY